VVYGTDGVVRTATKVPSPLDIGPTDRRRRARLWSSHHRETVLHLPAPSPRYRIGRSLAGALALTSWLVLSSIGAATPVLARTCGTVTIENGTVTPGVGTTETTFTFSVRVSDTTGAAPSWVRVRVNGVWSPLEGTGTDYGAGVIYSGTRKLPAGT
jgi:hypothetical protein